MKRIISFLLVVCIAIGTFALTATAAHDETTYTKTGNQAMDIVGIALTQVGYSDGGSNDTKYGAWAGNNYVGWCDIFVSWCAAKAGVSSSVVPQKSFGGADSGMDWYISKGLFKYRSSGYTPKTGDLIFLDWNDNNSPDHVGIVVETFADGSVRIVDGNYSDKVNDRMIYPNSGMVWNNLSSVIGYATPAYANSGSTSNIPIEETACDAYYTVATNDTGLLLRSVPMIGEALAEIPKGSMIHVTKTTVSGGNTWGYTTYADQSGWCHLGYTALVANTKDIQVTITAESTELKVGESLQLTGSIQPDSLAKLGGEWSSSDESVLQVDSYGFVTAISSGTAVISYASARGLGNTATFEIEVVAIDGYYNVDAGGDELILRASADINAQESARIPDGTMLHITDTKEVDGVTWGYTTYDGKTGWCAMQYTKLFVLTEEISISVVPTVRDMLLGGVAEFKGKIEPAALEEKGGTWASSDETIVTVDQNGHAVAVGVGKATLTYTSNAGIGEAAIVQITVYGEMTEPGDVDFDGSVSVADIMKTRNAIMMDVALDDSIMQVYDVTHDGQVNVSDVIALKIKIMEL